MKLLICLIFFLSSTAFAGGWSNAAVPTRVDIVRDQGLMVYGAFGNPAGCSASDTIFIQIDHPQYSQIYAATLAAFSAGKKIQIYVHICAPASWYSVDSITYNTMTNAGVLNILN